MSRVLSIVAALAAVGCTAPESSFDHQAELSVDARGVALGQDGLRGQVGMYNTTCAVDTRTATVGSDLDFDEGEEVVHDAGTVEGRDVFLVESSSGLHLQDSAEPLDTAEPVLEGRFDEAFVFDGGAAGFADGVLSWSTGEEIALGDVRSLDVSRDGLAFAADGLIRAITPAGERVIADGHLVAVDDAAGTLYAAVDGANELQILDMDGTQLHVVGLPGAVRDVTALGDRGAALVVVEHANGTGELMVVDSSGEPTAWVNTPSPADRVTASGDGETIAVTVPGSLHFFRVD